MNSKKIAIVSALALAAVFAVMIFGGRTTQAAASTWYVSPTGAPSGTSGGSCASPSFNTISLAIAAASNGDTIQVCVGTYNEQVQINKTLTLNGANAGTDARTRVATAESIITHPCGPVQIIADKVVLDGFTIQGSTLNPTTNPGCFGAGIWSNPGEFASDVGGHQILNNIVQNNISGVELDSHCDFPTLVQFNLIQNNNDPGAGQGNGIQDNFGLCNATIDRNKFVGNSSSGALLFGPPVNSNGSNITVSNNEFSSNGSAIALLGVTSSAISGNNSHNSVGTFGDIDIFGGVNGLSVTCNNLASGAGRGIQVEDPFAVGPNSNVTINTNNISGYPVGLEEDLGGYTPATPNSLDATNNWWGSPTGPTIASNPGGTGEPIVDMDGVVNYGSFLTSPSICAPCPNSNPGCTTTKKDCHKFVEQQEKDFNDGQKADKKTFDDQQKDAKKAFDATHPTAAQRKAFDEGQKNDKKNFDDGQKAAKDAFQVQHKANERQCNQLPN